MYEKGEHVVLWLNKVGPYHNPQETYSFYRMPFCRPDHIKSQEKRKKPGLGEILEGNEYLNSGLLVEFATDTPRTPGSLRARRRSASWPAKSGGSDLSTCGRMEPTKALISASRDGSPKACSARWACSASSRGTGTKAWPQH